MKQINKLDSNVKYSNDPEPITPDVLTQLLKVDAPAGTVLVQGIAREVKVYPGYVYGRIALGASSVSFRTPKDFAPRDGEAVTIKGTLKIEDANRSGEDWRATHTVRLIGKVVGNWEPRAIVRPVVQLPNRDERISLADFVFENEVAGLAVLVSGTARADIIASLTNAGVSDRPLFIEANFGNKDKFISQLRDLRNRHDITGFSIARGGGGGQEIIGGSTEIIREMLEMEKPFYVALGHATDLALIDKYADQSFHTPSAFGSAIAHALWSAYERLELENDRELLKKKNSELQERIETLERNEKRIITKRRWRALVAWLAVVLILVVCALLWVIA